MHLLLTLDLSDPLSPIASTGQGVTMLPLYYPLRYGFGGGEVQYSVVSDAEIAILSDLHREEVDDGAGYPFPDSFPVHPVSLVPLTYQQSRAIAASERGSNHYSDDPEWKADFAILQQIDYWRMLRLGDRFSPTQGDIQWTCSNRKCEWRSKRVRVDVFASVTSRLSDRLAIWGEDGPEIYFGLTSCCRTVVAVNRCT